MVETLVGIAVFCTGKLCVAKDIATIIGTLGAVTIGAMGLFTWRRQIHFDLSKKILVLSYQVRDALQAVRDPMVNIPRSDVESGKRIDAEQQLYRERWQIVTDRWTNLNVLSLEAVAVWEKVPERQSTV